MRVNGVVVVALALVGCAEGEGAIGDSPSGAGGTEAVAAVGGSGQVANGGSEPGAGGSGAGAGGTGAEPAPSGSNVAAANSRISLNARVTASAGVASPASLVDGLYHMGNGAVFAAPTEAAPQWGAIQVAQGPTRLLAIWKDAGWNEYNNSSADAANSRLSPADYRIEVSGDSTDGSDGTWETVVTVTNNPVNNRGHSFDFTGKSWVKLVVTRASLGANGAVMSSVALDELALHDLSSTPSGLAPDSWFFFGDSITQLAYRRDLSAAEMFDAQVAAQHTGYFPAMIDGGVGGDDMVKALARVDQALELNPDFKYFAIGFGTNDAWGNQSPTGKGYEAQMRQLIGKVRDAGRIPVLARIPSATRPATFNTLPDFNAIIDKLQMELGLPAGPDLFKVIAETANSLDPVEGVHPLQPGRVAMNKAWADAVGPLYTSAP